MTLIKQNIFVFLMLILSYLLVDGIGHLDFSIGNFLFLPLGATLYAYLFFSNRVLPAVILANYIVGYFLWDNWFGQGYNGFLGQVGVGSLVPMLSIYIGKSLRQLDAGTHQDITPLHVVFLLSILTAIFNTLGKFFVFMGNPNISIEPTLFLGSFMLGDILGCIVFMLLAQRFLSPWLSSSQLR